MEYIEQKIKSLRKTADLTQERLADYLGVSAQAVSKWEVGSASPDLSLIAPLCRVLGCSADELLGIGEDVSVPGGRDTPPGLYAGRLEDGGRWSKSPLKSLRTGWISTPSGTRCP